MSEPGILPEPIPFGKYYLLERINVGGMAEVYKAKAFGVEGFERLLAIKQILENIARDESFIKMFIDEAKIAGQLSHPNIAQIFDLGQAEGSYFIALEYISGKDLKTIFERARRIGEKVSIPRVCYTIMKICEGLGHAHEKKDPQGNDLNIVHRDISPQNVLMSFEGEVKVIDFGIAKAQGKTSQTQAGMLKGKFSYMSPEQVRGIHVDHRSDIFSLGIVLYELLTLERLFLGESDFEIMRKIRHVEMSPPSLYNPHVPKELEDIVLKALAGNSGDRYQSAFELAEDLEQFMRDQGFYYTNKDLASYMKEAFQADLEFENKKLEYYRSLNLQPIEQNGNRKVAPAAAPDLSWDDAEMETQIFDREDEEESISEDDIVYAEDLDSNSEVSEHEVTQIHVPGAAVPDDAPTVEFDRWDADLNLGSRDSIDDIDIEPRGGPVPTSQMPAVQRNDVPQVTVNAAVDPRNRGNKKSSGASLGRIALVALIVVALGMGYVYFTQETTTEVQFAFGDEPVRITVNDELIHDGPTPFSASIAAGQARIVVERDGHHPYEVTENFVAGEPSQLEAELEAYDYADTGFDLTTTPEEAQVFIDDEEFDGKTPIERRELEPGTYRVRAELEDYFPFEEEIEITFDEVAEFEWELRPTTIDLKISSDPDRADYNVYLTDSDESLHSGRTPATIEGLAADKSYRVVVERRRYEDWEETIEAGATEEINLSAQLIAADTPVASTSSSRPTTRRPTPTPDPPPRETTRRPDPEPVAAPTPAPTPEPEPEPEPAGTGTLSIASRPAARVFINDRDTGRYTPLMNFELPAGSHKVVLQNEEFNLNKTYYVDIVAGQSERVINR